MSNLINVNGQENFEKEVLMSELPVLVDFWAPWCGPCQIMTPVLEQLSKIFEDKLKIVKINTEESENQQISFEYQIQSIPNMKLFKNGVVIKDFIGFRPEETFSEELKPFLNK